MSPAESVDGGAEAGAGGSPVGVGVRVDRDSCVASGACAMFEPEFFDQSEEDGRVLPRVREAAPEALPALRRAAARCPVGAIALVRPGVPERAPADGTG